MLASDLDATHKLIIPLQDRAFNWPFGSVLNFQFMVCYAKLTKQVSDENYVFTFLTAHITYCRIFTQLVLNVITFYMQIYFHAIVRDVNV